MRKGRYEVAWSGGFERFDGIAAAQAEFDRHAKDPECGFAKLYDSFLGVVLEVSWK